MYYLTGTKLSFASLAEARYCFAWESEQEWATSHTHLGISCPAFKEFDPRVGAGNPGAS